jgi:hypothetical protein
MQSEHEELVQQMADELVESLTEFPGFTERAHHIAMQEVFGDVPTRGMDAPPEELGKDHDLYWQVKNEVYVHALIRAASQFRFFPGPITRTNELEPPA